MRWRSCDRGRAGPTSPRRRSAWWSGSHAGDRCRAMTPAFGLRAAALYAAGARRGPDVVHCRHRGAPGWSAVRAARSGHSVVSSFHTNFHSYGRHYGRHVHPRGLGCCAMCITSPARCPKRTLSTWRATASATCDPGARRGHRLFDPARRSEELRRSWGAGPKPVAIYWGASRAKKTSP
jgi:hypothetical protein